MFVGREAERQFLESHFAADDGRILVVYGRKGLGKTSLVRQFAAEKDFVYYLGRACSDKEQRYQWGEELRRKGCLVSAYPAYSEIWDACVSLRKGKKQILVLDEFHHFVKAYPSFISELVQYVKHSQDSRSLMVILCTSATGWVENTMISKIGHAAMSISGFWKMRELKFREIRTLYPEYPVDDFIALYGILGGNPGLWQYFSPMFSVRENLIRAVLTPTGGLRDEVHLWLSEELRETAVYQTILAGLAASRNKLNELHLHTEFSRAKISVYLKNLMELDLVEKVSSMETAGYRHTQKGVYRIGHSFVEFYYMLIFPHQSELEWMDASNFYDIYVQKKIRDFEEMGYLRICKEVLSAQYEKMGEWIGKQGILPIMGEDKDGRRRVVAKCFYHERLDLEAYQAFLRLLRLSKWEASEKLFFCEHALDQRIIRKLEREAFQVVSIKELLKKENA